MAFTARVPADACSRLADAASSEHDSYMALAMERELTTYSSLQMLRWAVPADSDASPCQLAWYALILHAIGSAM